MAKLQGSGRASRNLKKQENPYGTQSQALLKKSQNTRDELRSDKKTKDVEEEDAEIDMRVKTTLDVSLLDKNFRQFYSKSEVLTGVLNPKISKQKNQEIKMKLDAWKKRENERLR